MKLLTYKEAAELLHVSVSTLRTLVRRRLIKAKRIGYRTVRFDPNDITKFLFSL